MFYSKSKKGFYSTDIHGDKIPSDAVEITEETWKDLLKAQSEGKNIVADENGNPYAKDPDAPTKDQTIVEYEGAAQNNLDKIAQSWGYNSMDTAVSYANSTDAQYKADAEALIAWRDSYWAEAYTLEAGTLPATAEAFVALLPDAPSKPVI